LVEITRVFEVTVDAAPRLGDFKRECCLANLARPEKHNSRIVVQPTDKFLAKMAANHPCIYSTSWKNYKD